jgi:hypothetical protein
MKVRFWGSAVLVAVTFAAMTALLTPYETIGAETDTDRHRVLLLILWTSGVMAVCFGAAGLLAAVTPLGFRDVAETGSVKAAIEARQLASRRIEDRFFNFAGWMLATGVFLIGIYFAAWILGG